MCHVTYLIKDYTGTAEQERESQLHKLGLTTTKSITTTKIVLV